MIYTTDFDFAKTYFLQNLISMNLLMLNYTSKKGNIAKLHLLEIVIMSEKGKDKFILRHDYSSDGYQNLHTILFQKR